MSGNILIVGKGVAGQALAADIDRARAGTVVGFLDDVHRDEGVLGTLSDVNEVVTAFGVTLVYFAIPSAPAATVRRFVASLSSESLEVAIIPRTYAILTKETVAIGDLTDVDVLDLVGREPVKHDLLESHGFISGKTVLITGAAGSIGSRLVQQISAMSAARVVCVDWWENGTFQLASALPGHENIEYEIADVRGEARMRGILERHRPDVIFHAAAYKHVPLMQSNPAEAVNNNVGGSLTLMRLAMEAGVGNFVMVSTDKAVNPANVMGATKRIGEIAMTELSRARSSTTFNAVRFGNVIESNGSVMQTFRQQIAARTSLTVTHPEVTRFFMTLDEASQLVIQSAFAGRNGDIFVLDMGEPVRILDLARSLIATVEPSLSIDIVGLRPGEKMFEELSYEPDRVMRTANEKIFIVRDEEGAGNRIPLRAIDDLLRRTSDYSLDGQELIDTLRSWGFAVQDYAGSERESRPVVHDR